MSDQPHPPVPAPAPDAQTRAVVDAVVIGRNEGVRLQACLESLKGQVRRIVYVDSGSRDGSQVMAARMGVQVVALDMTQPFTAARARNAGLVALEGASPPDLVQLVDGDCEVVAGWVTVAADFLAAHPKVTVVCGRRRERFPEASVYNRLCDREWATPPGPARACGGDALMRYAPLMAVGGYREDLIAGEEPELCLRLIRAGGRVWRLDAEMTRHDAAMTRFGQWWKRTRRAGHAFAEGADLHGAGPERHWVVETRRALLWGLVLPVLAVVLALVWHPAWLLLLLAWPLQMLRLARREGNGAVAFYLVLGKLAEAQGVLGYWLGRLTDRRSAIIEYK